MLSHEKLQKLLEAGTKVFSSDGEKIGTLGHIYLDSGTGLPDFVTVHTGFLGTAENFVPLTGAEISDEQLYVNFSKDVVKDAPNIDPAVDLKSEDENRLYHYYSRAGLGSPRGAKEPAHPPANGGPDEPGATPRLPVGERGVRGDPSPGPPRLRKYLGPEPDTPGAGSPDADVGGTPRGQTPEEPHTDNSERTQTMRSGVPGPFDP